MATQRTYRLLSVFAFAGVIGGCSNDAPKSAEAASARGTHSDSAGGLVVAPSKPYVPGRGSAPSGLVINVQAAGAPLATQAGATCEVTAAKEASVSDAVLWIDGLRQGKPLPVERRYQLTSEGCALSPRVQAVVVGGAVNVFNGDRVLHTLVFVRAGTNDTLQTMPFTNDAQLVASDRLTKTPGIVDVSCAKHPQERAYIAVFDHPYFGVAAPGEKVTLDAVPPGDYQVVTWREGMAAPTSIATTVGASGQTQVIVK